ncbi:MAG: putative helicase [Frankiales bacterium]|nr:putative helicase [Frankiales bacterium]
MTVVIAKQYEKDLRVDGSMKARAWDFMMKLNNDPDAVGLDLKMPQGVIDRRVRTARVDQNFRAVLFALPNDMLVMAAIKPHDEAYTYASSVRLEINAANGAMELIAEEAIQRTVKEFRDRPRALDQAQILPFTPDELVGVGIRDDIAEQAVRVVSEDELLTLVEDIPEWQQQALLDLATGKSLEEVRADYGIGDEPTDDPEQSLQRPVSRMEFVTIQDDDELRRMIEGDFEEWRTFLHPQQRVLVERPVYNGPFRLAGGAGTGKTVVALHRAAFLAKRPGARVLLCTYNRTLAGALELQLRRLASSEALARIDVLGVDQAVNRTVREKDRDVPRPADARTQERLWTEAVASADVPSDLVPVLTPDFMAAELRAVMLGMPAIAREHYLSAKRPGRAVRLNRVQRTAVWRVVEDFQRGLRAERSTTFELLAARAAEVAQPRYDHVVLDEGQDLHAGHWRFLRSLVASAPNDMFICEDAHQRIYGERLVLSRYGIETRGRSRRLTLNYRSSRQNLRFALGVISGAEIVDSDGQLETLAGYRAAFDGPAPTSRGFATQDEEAEHLGETVTSWLDGGVEPSSIGVLVRRQVDQERARQALQSAGVAVEVLGPNQQSTRSAVVVTTMHRAKGMEFSRVVVFGVESTVVPLRFLLDQAPEPERETAVAKERSLLYVACSRARDELVVTWSGAPSPFLPDTAVV